LSTAIGFTPGGSSTVHIYTQTINRTTHLTTLVGRFLGFEPKVVKLIAAGNPVAVNKYII